MPTMTMPPSVKLLKVPLIGLAPVLLIAIKVVPGARVPRIVARIEKVAPLSIVTPPETNEEKGRIYIIACRDLKTGDELFFDYRLEAEGRRTKKLESDFRCDCGALHCRGTMLER